MGDPGGSTGSGPQRPPPPSPSPLSAGGVGAKPPRRGTLSPFPLVVVGTRQPTKQRCQTDAGPNDAAATTPGDGVVAVATPWRWGRLLEAPPGSRSRSSQLWEALAGFPRWLACCWLADGVGGACLVAAAGSG
ncbi:hypothetical protein ZWY2020_033973 [Hordeum vulgare]|nr:hypothetical protein ZWY2020_033973 [Hordeum vulgare]